MQAILKEVRRYLAFGFLAALCDFAVLYMLKELLGLNYLLAGLLAFLTGLSASYWFNTTYVFKGYYKKKLYTPTIGTFVLIGVVGVAINELALWLGVFGLGYHYMLAKLISAFITTAWNFLAKKFLLFNKHMSERIQNRWEN